MFGWCVLYLIWIGDVVVELMECHCSMNGQTSFGLETLLWLNVVQLFNFFDLTLQIVRVCRYIHWNVQLCHFILANVNKMVYIQWCDLLQMFADVFANIHEVNCGPFPDHIFLGYSNNKKTLCKCLAIFSAMIECITATSGHFVW